jgi:hypothetical protein
MWKLTREEIKKLSSNRDATSITVTVIAEFAWLHEAAVRKHREQSSCSHKQHGT